MEVLEVLGPVGEKTLDQFSNSGENHAVCKNFYYTSHGLCLATFLMVEREIAEDREGKEHAEMDNLVHRDVKQLLRYLRNIMEVVETQVCHGENVQQH